MRLERAAHRGGAVAVRKIPGADPVEGAPRPQVDALHDQLLVAQDVAKGLLQAGPLAVDQGAVLERGELDLRARRVAEGEVGCLPADRNLSESRRPDRAAAGAGAAAAGSLSRNGSTGSFALFASS